MVLEKQFGGKYKLIKLLNNGPYAQVYHAKDIFTGQSVAIKALQNCNTKNVEQEIQAMTRLEDHPHIIKLIEVMLADNDQVYVVTEYAKRGDLFELIVKSGGKFTEELSRHYFRQLISAVKHCHGMPVFHRDIKPENILLDDLWRVKLSDFGLCAVSENSDTAQFWDPCGTVEYAAPEVIMVGERGYDGAKADVWSCGVVLYVLVTGSLPFNCEGDVKRVWRKMMKGEFKLPKWLSPGLKWLLLRMLDSDPERRISVEEILEDGWFCQGYDDQVMGQV